LPYGAISWTLLCLAVLAACGVSAEHSRIVSTDEGFRTFTVALTVHGVPASCGGEIAPEPHVIGRLDEGEDERPEPVWLRDASGERLSVIWPEKWHVRFQPELALSDSQGRVVATMGDEIELNASRRDHAGTFDDPYIAQSIIGRRGCFLFRP
jgi:hypothetical protein